MSTQTGSQPQHHHAQQHDAQQHDAHQHDAQPQALEPVGAEAHNAGAGAGPVVIDIGDDVGALVLCTGPGMARAEIEISPAGRDDQRSHVAVLPRSWSGRSVHAAVYPSLRQGRWQLWRPDGTVAITVTIQAGEVTEADWPETG